MDNAAAHPTGGHFNPSPLPEHAAVVLMALLGSGSPALVSTAGWARANRRLFGPVATAVVVVRQRPVTLGLRGVNLAVAGPAWCKLGPAPRRNADRQV